MWFPIASQADALDKAREASASLDALTQSTLAWSNMYLTSEDQRALRHEH
jgi:hypothetical protein